MASVKMQDSVIFAGSSPENVAYAKEFWKSFDSNVSTKSTLHVSGINHRLTTAPSGSSPASKFACSGARMSDQDEHPGLLKNLNEAKRRLKKEEQEHTSRVLHQRKKQLDLLTKRKEERLQKEAVTTTADDKMMEEMFVYEDDNGDCQNEAMQAMNDIDDFERMVKLANEQKKEN